jgi:hypothetical protein
VLALSSAILAGSAGAMTFSAKADRVTVEGTTNGDSLKELENILATYPQVRVIILDKVEGSDDDSTNLRMAELIRSRGLQTHLTSQSVIESGGIELFMGGVKRTMERGARIGVHSWIDEDTGYEGRDLPADHPDHREYLDAYSSLGVPEALYWFILKAAPSTAMYFLNDDEIKRFSVLTAPIAVDALHANPPGQSTGLVEGAGDKLSPAIHALAPGDDDEDDDDDDEG